MPLNVYYSSSPYPFGFCITIPLENIFSHHHFISPLSFTHHLTSSSFLTRLSFFFASFPTHRQIPTPIFTAFARCVFASLASSSLSRSDMDFSCSCDNIPVKSSAGCFEVEGRDMV